jgi:hypothetical protein
LVLALAAAEQISLATAALIAVSFALGVALFAAESLFGARHRATNGQAIEQSRRRDRRREEVLRDARRSAVRILLVGPVVFAATLVVDVPLWVPVLALSAVAIALATFIYATLAPRQG